MTKQIIKSGRCLCGAVSFTSSSLSTRVSACHCAMCRKWGGGPFMEVDCGSDIDFEGVDAIKVYNSSDWAERGFCQHCGSHLFYRLKESRQHMVPVGLFDQQDDLVFENQVFIDKKPSYYCFSNNTEEMTEAEILALFASS